MKVRFYYLQLIVLCSLFFAAGASLFAKNYGIKIYGTYKVNGGETSGVQLRLLRNGIKESSNVSGNGKFEYSLQFNNQYELQFSKAGYITKKVVISTDVPERVLETNSDFPPFKIEIELFREVEGGDYSLFDEPVAMVIYDKELDDFDYDRAYNAQIEEKIKEVETKIINAPVVQKEDEKLRIYEELIKKADKEFDVKSYVNSRKNYEKALKIKPKENYPQIRIDLIDRLLADLEKREKQKEQNDAYYTFVDKADILFEEKNYPQARSYYVKAIEIKPEQQYPKDKIKLIDQIFAQREAEQRKYDNAVALADRYFKEEKYEYAQKEYEKALEIRKDEEYPKQQISRIRRLLAELQNKEEKESNYNAAIAKADAFFQEKNWFDARDAYVKASDILPDKKYPQEQIKAIDKILKSEHKELAQYTEAIKKADDFFNQEKWIDAQKHYERALKIKSEEVYPKEQIKKLTTSLANIEAQKAKDNSYNKEIEKGDRAFDRENWEEAKQAYFAALQLKPQEEYPQKRIKIVEKNLADLAAKKAKEDRYNEELKQADLHYDQKQWSEALIRYKAASEMKPSEKYPKEQITKIDRFLQEELKQKTAQELEDNYNKYIEEADQAFDAENWDTALTKYKAALQLKSNASYPQTRIKAINKRIQTMAEAEELQKKYEVVIAKADLLFSNSDWLSAIATYEKALDIKSDENYPKEQIKKIQATLSAEKLAKEEAQKTKILEEKRKSYEEAISKADKELANKQYSFAKQFYRKALSILPDEQYPKNKLKEIDDLFKKEEIAKRQKYKVLQTKDTINYRYYKRIVPDDKKETRYVKVIDATQANEAKYNDLIQKAEKAENEGNIPFAKAYYQQAYLEKPSLQIFNKLKELDRRIQVKNTK